VRAVRQYEVPWERICWRCNTSEFPFECTDQLTPLKGLIGQERALKAIQFGLEVEKRGFNLFVTGLTGTGKASAIKRHLQAIIDERSSRGVRFPIYDWCYIHNFADSDIPRTLRLPPGRGKQLHAALQGLQKILGEEMPKLFASEEYTSQRQALEEEGRSTYQRRLQQLEREVRAENFGLQLTPVGVNLFPITRDGRPYSPEEFMRLPEDERNAIDDRRSPLLQKVQETMEGLKGVEKDTQDKLRELDRSAGEVKLSDVFRPLEGGWRELPEVLEYLAALKGYCLDHLNLFTGDSAQATAQPTQAATPLPSTTQRDPFLPFQVAVLVDNSATQAAPIVIESNPSWGNLFGRIERRAYMGAYFSDHTMLRAGSIHHSNGGYLVLNARDVLMNPGVWEGLKRAIRDRQVGLEDPAVQFGLIAPQGLRPQPMPWVAKVIVTGDEVVYRLLSSYDHEDFWEMFKVKAEFDSQIDLTPESVADYCAFICGICTQEGLLHADRSGVARVVEYGARLVADQTKLSSRFGLIQDLLIEGDYWARKGSAELISGEHIRKALDEKLYRLNLVEEKLRQLMAEGTLMVDITGEEVGQANGLVVYDLGDFSFGRPARITAKTFSGRRGVINIEREAQLSGRIHDKGVLILSGYLGWKFAQDKPLSLSASLSFEQSYEGVEGDSASSTELYTILSSLSELPIEQSIAITGSVNQKGEIQPIGGVNQKVEGFFDICRLKGLTGDQGVIVPLQNVRNLMLREDVVDAAREGKFHIYAIRTIDQGIEVLTGVPAGERQPGGSYPDGTVNHLVDQKLRALAHSLRGFYAEALAEAAG
jgi:predicted ATP-dependent protease